MQRKWLVVASVLVFGCGESSDKDDSKTAKQEQEEKAPETTPEKAAPVDDGFGDVAFHTYQAGKKRIVFLNDTKIKKTWRNMSGAAVKGTYTKAGKEIVVTYDPAAKNHGSLAETFRQTGPCAMARYLRTDREGKVHDDSPLIYQRKKPKCDTVRVTK